MTTKTNSIIPTTGKIGRFAKILERETNRKTVEKVMKEADKYDSFKHSEKAEWWNNAMQKLENCAAKPTSINVMESCGKKCCGNTARKIAKDYYKQSKSVQEFIDKMNGFTWKGKVIGIGGGRLKLKDEKTIIGGYDNCMCGQVKQIKGKFSSNLYCHCSVGWFKQLFESAFERPIRVELKQSIICGNRSCEFIIHI